MIPNYPMNYQPYNYQQPYQQQFPVQNQGNKNLMGAIVEDFTTITANDVAMDGNPSVFIKRDMTEIQVRKWGADGRIYTYQYKPVEQEQPTNPYDDRLKAIEEKLDKLLKPTTKKVNTDATN